MNAATIGTLFAVIAVAMTATAHPAAYAEHADDPTVRTPAGSGVPGTSEMPGCEEDNTCFIPSTIEVAPGTTVTWVHDDATPHTITSGSLTDGGPDDMFDSGLVMAGESFEHTFDEVGEYPYFCIVHPWMTGMVLVTEEDDHGHGHDDETEPMMENTMMGDDAMNMENGMMGDDAMNMENGMMGDDAMNMENGMMDPPMMETMETTEGSTMTLGGEVMVRVAASGDPTEGEPLELALSFMDAGGEMTEHANFDVLVRQGNTAVYQETGVHAHQTDGPAMVTTRALASDEPVDVEVTFQGFGLPGTPMAERTGPTGVMVEFEQVPEFGTVAVMVLVAAIVSIVAVTSRSGILQRV